MLLAKGVDLDVAAERELNAEGFEHSTQLRLPYRLEVGAEDIVNFSYKPNYLDRFAEGFGTMISEKILNYINIKLK